MLHCACLSVRVHLSSVYCISLSKGSTLGGRGVDLKVVLMHVSRACSNQRLHACLNLKTKLWDAEDIRGSGVATALRATRTRTRTAALTAEHSGNRARALSAITAKTRAFQPVVRQLLVRRGKHDPANVMENIALVPPVAMAQCLHAKSRQLLFGRGGEDAEAFWAAYRVHRPDHPIFAVEGVDLKNTFPFSLHGDEGSGLAEVRGCLLV